MQIFVGKEKYRITHCSLFIVHCSLLIVLCSLLFSCQTMQTPDSFFDEGIIPLDPGASIYLFANVQQSRSIIEMLDIDELSNKDVKQMIDKTNNAMIALFPSESGRRFQIAAWGNYPGSGAEIALTFNKNWQKYKLDKTHSDRTGSARTSFVISNNYWHSGRDRLSLALNSRNAFIAAWLNDTPASPFAAGIEMPKGFNLFNSEASISCWINNPAPIFQRIFNDIGAPIRVPVDQLFLKLNNISNSNYEATVRLVFETPAYARTVAAILGFARNFSSPDPEMQIVMLFLANPPVQNGNNVDINTAPLTESDILKIINTFSSL